MFILFILLIHEQMFEIPSVYDENPRPQPLFADLWKYSNRPVNVICKDGQFHFSFEQWVPAEAPGKIPFP